MRHSEVPFRGRGGVDIPSSVIDGIVPTNSMSSSSSSPPPLVRSRKLLMIDRSATVLFWLVCHRVLDDVEESRDEEKRRGTASRREDHDVARTANKAERKTFAALAYV